MLNLFKKKPPKIIIECSEQGITIDGKEILFPAHLNALINILGEPDRKEHHLMWCAIWDKLGIYADYATWDNVLYIGLLLNHQHEKKAYPKSFFTGKIIVDGREVQDENFDNYPLKKHKIWQMTYKGKIQPYAISIGKNFDYKEKIPKDKYTIKPLQEEVIEFKDFGFKLSIIQELMCNKDLLQPKFDLYEFVEWYDKREIDIEEEGYEPIAEVTQYFKDLPIPKRLATEITEIYQDGGNDVYLQLLRFGDGLENYWDIESIEDVQHFPNLKKVVLCYAKDGVIEAFNQKGIQADWL